MKVVLSGEFVFFIRQLVVVVVLYNKNDSIIFVFVIFDISYISSATTVTQGGWL